MSYEKTKKLINNIVNNEFNHIMETQEYEESIADTEINMQCKEANDLLNKLFKVAPEHSELIEKLECKLTDHWTLLCRYYFKKGVACGTSNLNFIRDITGGRKFY